MVSYSSEIEQMMQSFYSSLNERDRRRYAALEAQKLGWGGGRYISQILGCDDESMRLGKVELSDPSSLEMKRIRRPGGGRKSAFETIPCLDDAFLKVVSHQTAGSPMDETVKWTHLSRLEIAERLLAEGITVSVTVVDQLLERHHYRRRKAQKRISTGNHAQRNEQFENIEILREVYAELGNPIISMDTKKKS
jgi:Rhodopirellula transposase DDE domain